ncbi:DUF1819 family protein [Enterococcus cecorum]|uniref:DUF1819 family protein n=1 Tax=Enterococcus cecorum TaxID=44008 RepID=UPI001FAE3974|nr:DUF1819 family protein [Enterococcus cecorum]MCJ0567673.1 DUF1819 family protein [Enterococcus cecorum]
MERKYSAGLVSQSFWFVEFKKVIKLLNEGKTEKEIKELCINDNFFGAINENRAKRMYGYIWNRVKRLDDTMIHLFETSDLTTQKLINLIAILLGDRLFLEFIFEVYREKMIIGTDELSDFDLNIFFKNKEVQSDTVATWIDRTKKRLGSAYYNFMIDSNLITVVDKKKMITPPVLDITLERYLVASGNEILVKAIKGVS